MKGAYFLFAIELEPNADGASGLIIPFYNKSARLFHCRAIP